MTSKRNHDNHIRLSAGEVNVILSSLFISHAQQVCLALKFESF